MLYSKIEGEGKPLVIVHGFLGMSDNWKSLGIKFSQAGYQVHMLDLRNHGRSLHSEEFNYEVMVQDVYEYCVAHNLSKIVLLGHSMGGKLAMFFAHKYPDLLDKIIIADIGPRYYKLHHIDIMNGLNQVDFSVKPSRSDVEVILKKHISEEGVIQFLMKSLYWKEPGQLDFRFNVPVFDKNIEEIGKEFPEENTINLPTLFLSGTNSNYIKSSDHEAILKQFPKGKIVDIKNAGHWLHAENPADFYTEVIAFLEE